MIRPNAPNTTTLETPLPFDLRTVAVSILRYRWILLLWLVGSLMAGGWLGLTFGPQTYRSEVVLKYEPPGAEIVGGVYDYPSISTHVGMVKVPQALKELVEDLDLATRADRLGAAIDVENPKDTKLLQITARWSSARDAQAIAELTALRFIERERAGRNDALSKLIINLEQRQAEIDRKLSAVTHVDKDELLKFQREQEDLRRRLDENSSLTERTEANIINFMAQLQSLGKALEEEEAIARNDPSANADPVVISHEIAELRYLITQTLDEMARDRRVEQRMSEIDFLQRQVARGNASQAELDAVRNDLAIDRLSPLTAPEVQPFRDRLQELSELLRSSQSGNGSVPILAQLKGAMFTAESKLEGYRQELDQLRESRRELERQLAITEEGRPVQLENEELTLLWLNEREAILGKIARIRTLIEGEDPFRMISRADVPQLPEKSYRKIGAVGAAMLLIAIGFGFVVLRETTYTRLRSRGDVRVRLGIDVWSELPEIRPARGARNAPPQNNNEFGELTAPFVRRLAHRLIESSEDKPVRVLVASSNRGEGRSMITWSLARSMALQGQRVTVIDGNVSTDPREDRRGLTDYLLNPNADLENLFRLSDVMDLRYLPVGTRVTDAERVAHPRFTSLLDQLESQGDIVVIDGAPLRQQSESDLLATQVDAVVLVVEADRESYWTIRKSLERFAAAGTPVIGIVLNRVEKRHFDKDWS